MNYKELYYLLCHKKRMPICGLCPTIGTHCGDRRGRKFINLMRPSEQYKMSLGHGFWGSGSKSPLYYKFTPLRQNLLLLMAAEQGEL